MSTSPAIAGCQFELNRPLSDSDQRLSASANSVRDKQDPFRVTIMPPLLEVVIDCQQDHAICLIFHLIIHIYTPDENIVTF